MNDIANISKNLKSKRWFLENNRFIKTMKIVESKKFEDFNQILFRIILNSDQEKDYSFPINNSNFKKNNPLKNAPLIDFSNKSFLQKALNDAGIEEKIENIETPKDQSTNPVFFINNKYCLKFNPRIIYEENREILFLQKLKGLDCISQLLGWQMEPKEHSFCLITKLELNSESAWDGIVKLLEQEKYEQLEKEVKVYGQKTCELHTTLQKTFPIDDTLSSRKECYYNSLALALNKIKLNHISINANELPPLQFIHGDLHLGQILSDKTNTAKFKLFLDFEGAPLESLHSRQKLKSPLHDIAGMLRSLDYAIVTTLNKKSKIQRNKIRDSLTKAFLDGYFGINEQNPKIPKDKIFIIYLYCLQRSIYELSYEESSRPNWAWIPRKGMNMLLKQIERHSKTMP